MKNDIQKGYERNLQGKEVKWEHCGYEEINDYMFCNILKSTIWQPIVMGKIETDVKVVKIMISLSFE